MKDYLYALGGWPGFIFLTVAALALGYVAMILEWPWQFAMLVGGLVGYFYPDFITWIRK